MTAPYRSGPSHCTPWFTVEVSVEIFAPALHPLSPDPRNTATVTCRAPTYKGIARLHEVVRWLNCQRPGLRTKPGTSTLPRPICSLCSENGSLHGCNLPQTVAQTSSNMCVLYKALRRVTLSIADSQGHGTMVRARLRSGRLVQMATCRVADGATSFH
jgi:hypothetical protein